MAVASFPIGQHLTMKFLALFFLLLAACSAYKIVLLAADVSDSQVIFNYRVASTLADAGHNVTVAFIASYQDRDISMIKIPKNVNSHFVDANVGFSKDTLDKGWADLMYEELPASDPRQKKLAMDFLNILTTTCKNTVNNAEFFKWLEAQKFDLAFANAYHMCSVGIIERAKIPSWIWLDSGLLKEFVAGFVGVPIFPSFTSPIHTPLHDELDFFQRIKSLKDHFYGRMGWNKLIVETENNHFQDAFGPSFPDLRDVASKCPLVMVNDNDLYGMPRPTLAKVISIGGLGAGLKDAKPLPKKFAELADNAKKGVVLISLGSVARLHMAPDSWKQAFIGAFKRLPDYQFIMRYEGTDLDGVIPPNVFLSKWVPQSDLLQHKNTKAFVTHGGYNSLQETLAAGVPTVMIGLFGDQAKNSQVGKKHGFAEVLSKGNFTADSVFEALDKVLHNPKYSQKAKRFSQMINKQPVAPETLVVKWAEFVAEFKHLENMEPASQKLNFFQLLCLDIIGGALLLCLLALFIVVYILRKIYNAFSRENTKEKRA